MSVRYRVLHLVHSDQRRGAEVFAAQLANGLSSEHFENALCVLYPTENGDLPSGGIHKFVLDGSKEERNSRSLHISKILELRKVLKQFRPDVLLAHGASSLKYGAIGRVLHRNSVAVYRNIGMASFWTRTRFKAELNRMFLRQFSVVVSVSSASREDFIRLYRLPANRVLTIPNGVDTTLFEASSNDSLRSSYRRSLGLDENDQVLISVGSLSPEKNHSELLHIVHSQVKKGKPVHLLIVGDGPLRETLEDQANSLGISDSVHFLGVRNDIGSLLGAADLFVLPSKTESMPAALIEAGIAGLPSVAYNVGAVADVVEDGMTGAVVPEGDKVALERAVSDALSDKARSKTLGAAARVHCLERFSMTQVAGMYERLFLMLLDNRARGSNEETQESLLAH